MSAMLAGSFIGPVGSLSVRSPSPTVVGRMGAGVRQSIADSYLRSAGMPTRGGISMGRLGSGENLCTDPGWQVAQSIIGVAGSIITGAAGEDRGWAAAGAGATGAASLWQSTCARQAAAGQTSTPPTDQTAALQAALAAQQANAAQDQLRLAQQQQLQAQQAAQRNQQVLLVAGIGAVVIIGGVLLLRRK